ncbi:hypothetical protein AZL_002200 [Azospirillum sp. B510]|uniref:hypothetical protein n=1 Tax=Azospirillum sp. (strain B510) TaxID=137722 RepID=UPI0001C4C22B|nr:hypothetical protein [Azospirillum sp. B510]BAI70858.1 hypothetical protein AZL_002200 [Azospirillum sp. B510]
MNRKFLASALSLALVALSPLAAHAGGGRAYLPYLGVVSGTFYTTVTVANVTDRPVTVTAKFYDKTGTPLTTGVTTYDLPASGELAGKRSATFAISGLPANYGFGVIDWTNRAGEDDPVALVAHGVRQTTGTGGSTVSEYAIPVNGGVPF